MSMNIPAAFIDTWNEEAKLAYQYEKSYLRDSVRTVSGVIGRTHKFPLIGSGAATVGKARYAPLQPMNVATSEATANLTPVVAPISIDEMDLLQTNMDVRKAYTETVVAAVSRALDDNIIASLATTTNTVTLPESGVLDLKGLTACNKALSLNNVPHDQNRYVVISPEGTANILTDGTLVNNLYVDKGALQQGYAKGVNGFTVIESTRLTGVAASGGSATCFAYHKMAVGLAFAMDIELTVDYLPERLSWLVNAKMMAGSVLIDPTGCFSFSVTN